MSGVIINKSEFDKFLEATVARHRLIAFSCDYNVIIWFYTSSSPVSESTTYITIIWTKFKNIFYQVKKIV